MNQKAYMACNFHCIFNNQLQLPQRDREKRLLVNSCYASRAMGVIGLNVL